MYPNKLALLKTNRSGAIEWQRGWNFDKVTQVVQTSDGGYAFAGDMIYNVTLMKLNSDGSDDWNETYHFGQSDVWWVASDSSGTRLCNRTIIQEPSVSVYDTIETNDGGYASVGRNTTQNRLQENWDNTSDMVLYRTDVNGDLLWIKDYPRNTDVSSVGDSRVVQTNDGGFLFTDTARPQIMIKADSEGSLEWIKEFPQRFLVSSVIKTSDGGLAFGGTSDQHYSVIKADSSGNIQWSHDYGTTEWTVEIGNLTFPGSASYREECMIETSDGGLLMAGTLWERSISEVSFFLAKTQSFLPQPTPSPSPPPSTPTTTKPTGLELPLQIWVPIAVAIAAISALIFAIMLWKRLKTAKAH